MNTLLISLLSYLIFLIFLVFYLNKKQSVESYFLNQRHTHLGVMTMSLVTTILGTGATVVVISEVYNSGISYGLAFLISSITGLVVLAACAKQIKTYGDIYKATTISDFFGRRFNRKVKVVTAIFLLLIVLIVTAIQLTAVSVMLTIAFNIPYWAALFLVGSIRLLYTTVGGFRFGLVTDLINGWVLLFVFVFVGVMGLTFITQNPSAVTLPDSFNNPIAYGGFWWFAGTILLAGFAQVANASQWQRIMSADNVKTVENSFKLAIPLVILIGSIIAFLGILAYKLSPGLAPENALFALIETVLPLWFAGIVFAIMIAVFTTALDNQIVAGSAIVFGLLYQRHDLTHKESILNARLITAILSVIGFLLALIHPQLVRFSSFSTHIALIIGPVLVATLFTSNKKSSEAVLWSLIIPFVVLCVLYPFMKSATFVITTPLTLIILKYYDKWTAPRMRVYT